MGYRLGIDFGTVHTTAAAGADGRATPLEFDGSPLLPSAVLVAPDGTLVVGAAAVQGADARPDAFEPYPQRHLGGGPVRLGGRELAPADLAAAVLGRVRAEAERAFGPPEETVLTHPATWPPDRLDALADAARRAGLGAVRLLPTPVAAAAAGPRDPQRDCVVVYDLGSGTFSASVVRREDAGVEVMATEALDDVGGLTLDAAIVGLVRRLTGLAPQDPIRPVEWAAARSVREQLARHPQAEVVLAADGRRLHISRDDFDQAVAGPLQRTVEATAAALRKAGVGPERIAALYVVGGAARVPLAAALLHRGLGLAPQLASQPELAVATGAVLHRPAAAAPAGPERGRPRRLLLWTAVALVLVCGAGAGIYWWSNRPPALVFPEKWAGKWVSYNVIVPGGQQRNLTLDIPKEGRVATVHYDNDVCVGTLTVTERRKYPWVAAKEAIASGPCEPPAKVVLFEDLVYANGSTLQAARYDAEGKYLEIGLRKISD